VVVVVLLLLRLLLVVLLPELLVLLHAKRPRQPLPWREGRAGMTARGHGHDSRRQGHGHHSRRQAEGVKSQQACPFSAAIPALACADGRRCRVDRLPRRPGLVLIPPHGHELGFMFRRHCRPSMFRTRWAGARRRCPLGDVLNMTSDWTNMEAPMN